MGGTLGRNSWSAVLASPPAAAVARAGRTLRKRWVGALERIHPLAPLVAYGVGLALAAVWGFMAVGAATGAGAGAAAGRVLQRVVAGGLLAEPSTSAAAAAFEVDVAGAFRGGVLGAAAGFLLGVRRCALWAEVKLLYHPRRYGEMDVASGPWQLGGRPYVLEVVPYSLSSGLQQKAFVLRPEAHGAEMLWVFFGGNAMVALDWLPICERLLDKHEPTRPQIDGWKDPADCLAPASFLLFDYPGYGWNEGGPSPKVILEATSVAIRAALAHLPGPPPRVHLLGHSLGSAAAAQAAVRLAADGVPATRLVLSAPFVSIPHVAAHLAGTCRLPRLPRAMSPLRALGAGCMAVLLPLLPSVLRLLVPHVWSNDVAVKRAAAAGWRVGVLHGEKDDLVPAHMGVSLYRIAVAAAKAAGAPPPAHVEVPRAGHNNVLLQAIPDCARLMGLAE